jgi:hypothetical protein
VAKTTDTPDEPKSTHMQVGSPGVIAGLGRIFGTAPMDLSSLKREKQIGKESKTAVQRPSAERSSTVKSWQAAAAETEYDSGRWAKAKYDFQSSGGNGRAGR